MLKNDLFSFNLENRRFWRRLKFFNWIQNWSSSPKNQILGQSDEFSQNIKTVYQLVDRRQASKFSLLPAQRSVPFFIFFTQIKKPRTLDPSLNKEEARPQNLDISQGNSRNSSVKELKETLDLASAYVRIRGDAASSGQECGEALDSVLRRNLSRRLDSIVLAEEDSASSKSRQYQTRESVITRTPTRLATTSTPSSSPIPPPIPPKKCQTLVPPIPIHPQSRSCSTFGSCSDVSSIQGEVFTDGEVFDNPVPSFEAHLIPLDLVVPVHETSLKIAMEESEQNLY